MGVQRELLFADIGAGRAIGAVSAGIWAGRAISAGIWAIRAISAGIGAVRTVSAGRTVHGHRMMFILTAT